MAVQGNGPQIQTSAKHCQCWLAFVASCTPEVCAKVACLDCPHVPTITAVAVLATSHTRVYTAVPQVARVHYPGLPSHPHHKRVKGVFSGYGGMLAVELKGGVVAAEAMLQVSGC
jgi:hypothetical protein